MMSPLSQLGWIGGLIFRRFSTTSGRTLVVGSPNTNFAFASCVSGVAITWSRPDVDAWDPSQNSVDPVRGLKGQRGILAMTKNGHLWRSVVSQDILREKLMYLGVEESNVFVDRLPQAMGMRKRIISCQEIPYWLCTEITISDTVKRVPLDRP